MGNLKIDGSGGKGQGLKTNLSKRAQNSKLFVETIKCPYCSHKKAFTGNPQGLNIRKCAKCKRRF
jgi:hypothetical protein